MNEQAKPAAGKNAAEKSPGGPQQQARQVSDPRDVAALILSRMNQVNVKKDELTIAIKGLSDITQQLARAYAEQMQSLEHLARRVKVLEAAAGKGAASGNGTAPPEVKPDEPRD